MSLRSDVLGDNVSLGCERLFGWLQRTGTSQYALAKLVGVQDGLISKWLRGHQRPSLPFAIKLHVICGIALDAWAKPPTKLFRTRFAKAVKRAA